MTNEERNNAIRCVKKWSEENPYLQTYKTCLEALEQCQATDVAEHLFCDRNICVSNEYSGIGCDKCICNTKDGYCQQEDLEEVIPIESVACKNIDIDRIAQEYFDDRESEFEMDEIFVLAKKGLAINKIKEDIKAEIDFHSTTFKDGMRYIPKDMALDIINRTTSKIDTNKTADKRYTLTIIFTPDKCQVLMVLHNKQHMLNFVGGHIEPGEDEMEASYRELFEETGITKDDVDLKFIQSETSSFPDSEWYLYITAGILKYDVELKEEKNSLHWVSVIDNRVLLGDTFGDGNCYVYVRRSLSALNEE